jgi:hypothetical protein
MARLYGIRMCFRGRDGDELRCFHLQIALFNEKSSDCLDQPGAQTQALPPAVQVP